jgi:hypothetical protein
MATRADRAVLRVLSWVVESGEDGMKEVVMKPIPSRHTAKPLNP